jgi:hypothetical protein
MANRHDNFLALADALALVKPLASESERSSEPADKGHPPFRSEDLTLGTSFGSDPLYRPSFGLTVDAGPSGAYVEICFGSPTDTERTRVYVGQTARWERGVSRAVYVRASSSGSFAVSWHIDRFTSKTPAGGGGGGDTLREIE